MPPSEQDRVLKPIEFLRADEVPGAGHRELVNYERSRHRIKEICFTSVLAAAVCGLVAALVSGAVSVFGLYMLLATFFLGTAGYKFWQLVAGPKSWHALPEGANEATALLEDATAKSVREWNADVGRWNASLVQLDVDAALWRMRCEDPSARPDGWSEESQVWEGGALLARGQALVLGRKRLHARRRMIERAIGTLRSRLRRLEQESQLVDPEPEDG